MKSKIVSFLKSFSVMDWILLAVSYAAIICSFVLSPYFGADRSVLSMITSFMGVVGILLIARGYVAAHYVYIVYSVLYTIVSIFSAYYGEAIIYCFLMLPTHIISIVSWKKHLAEGNSGSVNINKTSYKSTLLLVGLAIVLTVPFYFLLKALHTDNLLFSTLSFGTSLIAAVLMFRRVKYFSLVFAADDLFSILLWGAKIFSGTFRYVPILIVYFVALSNDTYSFAKWCIRYRIQKRGENKDE